MASNARGNHVSPGVYQKEIDLSTSVKSLGITSLGLAGETLKGPAFEPIEIEDWSTFKQYFGGTSAEKFAGSQYPKYELPYIAKSYLGESKRLTVCRVLGLCGYNAGPAWFICATNEDASVKQLVAVIRSRGHYNKYAKLSGETACGNPVYKYDEIQYDVDNVTISPYISLYTSLNCDKIDSAATEESFDINANNYGQFTLNAYKNEVLVASYGVSLNAGSKNYIIDVLGGKQEDGDAALFVEELYDVALIQAIEEGRVTEIYHGDSDETDLDCQKSEIIIPIGEAVNNLIEIPEDQLTRKNMGQRFLADSTDFNCHVADSTGTLVASAKTEVGAIYTVKQFMVEGAKKYFYVSMVKKYDASGKTYYAEEKLSNDGSDYIYVNNDERYFYMKDGVVYPVAIDMNDYKEQYRCASTPWIVSELKGDGQSIDVKKLFRFHTISDGNDANTQVKVSIQNIRPDEGLFDVLIRDFSDSDGNMTILERYGDCNMIPQTSNYIGYKIGTTDGAYSIKSKYVTVEVIENDVTAGCVPCGFLGYPIRAYDGIEAPELKYNCVYDEDIKDKKQYFGMSDLVGVDVDVLTYKGVAAYSNNAPTTNGFHLDSNANEAVNPDHVITVDGESGYIFSTVSPLSVTDQYSNPSLIGTEEEMQDTIFANVNLRKFTVYPCGGYDGWDVYREARTTGDDFKANKYKGTIENGVGRNFSKIKDGDLFDLPANSINSDYYAFLAAYNCFENKEAVDMNLFATPGIDYVNQKLLSQDVLDMIEDDERRDVLYVMTTPDKPYGASDSVLDMYTAQEAVGNLEDSDIDTSYACTYYPWVKYLDTENDCYINLPVTKDVMRNFAMTDNNQSPWFASAGISRGPVDCERAHKATKLAEEDTLYEGMINPVKTFAQDGVKIWGNKTMYSQDTPLNRVNTRRLMLRIEKLVENGTRGLLFDPNDTTLKDQFRSIVKAILENVKSDRGISDYRIAIDDSAEARDRHELPAVVKVKPVGALEYIDITYHVTPEGVEWED